MKSKENYSKAKDLAAQQHGYTDWFNVDNIDEGEYYKDQVKLNMMEEVAEFYADQQTAALQAEVEGLREDNNQLQNQIERVTKGRDLILQSWRSVSSKLQKWKDAIEQYLDDRNCYSIKSFIEDYELDIPEPPALNNKEEQQ